MPRYAKGGRTILMAHLTEENHEQYHLNGTRDPEVNHYTNSTCLTGVDIDTSAPTAAINTMAVETSF